MAATCGKPIGKSITRENAERKTPGAKYVESPHYHFAFSVSPFHSAITIAGQLENTIRPLFFSIFMNKFTTDLFMMGPAVKIIQDFPSPTDYRYDEELWYRQHGNSFVIINCQSSNIFYPEHWTPLSMKCVMAGKEFYKFSNYAYAVTPDRFLLLNEGSEYASHIDPDYPTESFTLNFTKENIGALSALFYRDAQHILDNPFHNGDRHLRFIEKLYAFNPHVSKIICDIKRSIDEEGTDQNGIVEKLYHLLYELMLLDKNTWKAIENIQSKKACTREELFKRLTVARDYMESCYHENITLEKMSKVCHLNPYYLLREFKKNFHITPHQYLITARLNEAKKLIMNSGKPINQIAGEVGFETISSFCRSYKKYFGFAPQAHRLSQ